MLVVPREYKIMALGAGTEGQNGEAFNSLLELLNPTTSRAGRPVWVPNSRVPP